MAKTTEDVTKVEVTENTEKTVAKKTKENSEIELLKKQLEQQNLQIEMLMKMISNGALGTAQTQTATTKTRDDEVKIIHLVERGPGLSTFIQLSNLQVVLTKFGEERVLTLQQFEELIGKHRKWFDDGMLSVAAGYEEIARKYGLKTAANYPIDSEFIAKLGTLNLTDIETMYERLPESGKDFILSYWNRKTLEGDPKFRDLRKLETLNRVSNGAFENLITDVRTGDRKTKK